jgi:uncharacterized membrane protein
VKPPPDLQYAFEEGMLNFLWLIPIAAVVLTAIFGALFLVGAITVAGLIAVHGAMFPTNPVDPEEEIRGS